MANGKAGAPMGNTNSSRGCIFRTALENAIRKRSTRTEQFAALVKVADALIDKAIGGDVAAMREIADRLDGKAKQQIENTGDSGPLIVKIIKPGDADD
jgi:ribosomal protein L17